jgi:MoaA/NifB/PqqE/SkfB family radical SAM enzyme
MRGQMRSLFTTRLPKALDLRILGTCDFRCPFCFGPQHDLAPAKAEALLGLITSLPSFGVETIVITGGEPTLVPELPLLLRTAKQVGLRTILSTNGPGFQRRLRELAPLLDWVGLPLDADNPEVNHRMRVGDPRHFSVIRELLETCRRDFPSLKIKLGTVVCALNKHHVAGIPELVRGPFAPDIWKLYQVIYSSYGFDNKDLLELSDADFESVAAKVEAAAHQHAIHLVVFRRRDREGTYLFVEPTGDVVVVSDGRETTIGNAFVNLAGVVASWHGLVNEERLEMNQGLTYPP